LDDDAIGAIHFMARCSGGAWSCSVRRAGALFRSLSGVETRDV